MGSQPNYGQLEGALRKHNPGDLESGIDSASHTINEHTRDAKLYLLRAKLSYKLILVKRQHKVTERLRNCLGDCEQAIAIIERGIERGDITMIKKHALQLGYLCCMRLKNVQKEKEFERRMSEMKINYPIPNHTINQLLFISQDQQGENHTYNLKEMLFPKVSFIETPLLEDVIRCYKDRQTVCRNCFCNNLELSRGYDANGKCIRCQWEYKKLLVIPKSLMTVNYYKSEMIAIPPWPKSKPNELPFESCAKPTDKSHDHKRCLIMSRNSAVWYAHTVEELVIWTVEREYGCSFEDFIRKYEPFQPVPSPAYQSPLLNPLDSTVYYPPPPVAASVAIGQTGLAHAYPGASNPYFTFPLMTAISYNNEGLISPPTPYSIPASIPPSTPVSAPAQLVNDKMVKSFENITVSSQPASPQVTDDIEQPAAITGSNTVDNDNVSE